MPLLLAAASIEQELAPGASITQDALNAALRRPPGDPQTATTLVQLSAADYFRDEQSVEQIDGPISRLGERALQRVAGWPGAGGDLASELLALIDHVSRSDRLRGRTHSPRAPSRHRRRRGQGRGHRPADRPHQEPQRRLSQAEIAWQA
jgi:hypothetical protein